MLQVLEGRPELFIRGDAAEQSWRIVGPIMDAWRRDRVPLIDYLAGSDGPVLGYPAADNLRAVK